MRLDDFLVHCRDEQKVRYSLTTLTDNCRGWIYDSPIMTVDELRQEKHILDGCVTSFRAEGGIIVIYTRQHISFSDL